MGPSNCLGGRGAYAPNAPPSLWPCHYTINTFLLWICILFILLCFWIRFRFLCAGSGPEKERICIHCWRACCIRPGPGEQTSKGTVCCLLIYSISVLLAVSLWHGLVWFSEDAAEFYKFFNDSLLVQTWKCAHSAIHRPPATSENYLLQFA